jgi:hypothetical protein
MMPKHSAIYRQFQSFAEIIQLIKDNKPVVYQRLLETYQQNAAAIFTQDIQVFYDNMRQEMQNRPGMFALSRLFKLFLANTLQELDEFGRLFEVVLGETSTVVDSEQKFLTKCMHIPSIDKNTNPPQLSDQMRNAIKPIFGQLPESFRSFSRSCTNRGHL